MQTCRLPPDQAAAWLQQLDPHSIPQSQGAMEQDVGRAIAAQATESAQRYRQQAPFWAVATRFSVQKCRSCGHTDQLHHRTGVTIPGDVETGGGKAAGKPAAGSGPGAAAAVDGPWPSTARPARRLARRRRPCLRIIAGSLSAHESRKNNELTAESLVFFETLLHFGGGKDVRQNSQSVRARDQPCNRFSSVFRTRLLIGAADLQATEWHAEVGSASAGEAFPPASDAATEARSRDNAIGVGENGFNNNLSL